MPASVGDAHGLLRRGAERVDDADEADEFEVLHLGHRVGGNRRAGREAADGEREHAQALLRELAVRVEDGVARLLDGHRSVGRRDRRAALEDDIRPALDQLDEAGGAVPGHLVEGRHELVRRVERHLRRAGVLRAGQFRVGAHLGGEHDERGLRRVADHIAVVRHGRVAAQRQAERELGEVGVGLPRHLEDLAGLLVPAAADGVPLAREIERLDGHLVHRERAGLVGVDRARRAERLDIRQVLDDRVVLGELPRAERQHRLHERRHAGGDGRDRHRDAEQDDRRERLIAQQARR